MSVIFIQKLHNAIVFPFREEDYDEGETSTKKSREVGREFRNHKPDDAVGTQNVDMDLDIVQREITEHLKVESHRKITIFHKFPAFSRTFCTKKPSTA